MINSIACSKLILFGEHAVVHGEPAIAVPVQELSTIASIEKSENLNYSTELDLDINQKKNLRKLINFLSEKFKLGSMNIKIDSSIPISSGLGSSASLSIALIRGMNELYNLKLSNEKINESSFECEKIFHGTPSGIDNTVINYEKPILFKNGKFEFIGLKKPLNLLIVDSGIKASTKDVIFAVKNKFESKKQIISGIGKIAVEAKKELELCDLKKIGRLMTKNHELLKELGVSCKELDEIVEKSIKAGAYGAKLSGKGMGGIVIILAKDDIKLPFEYMTTVIE